MARHLLAVAIWWIVNRLASPTAARQRLTAFTLGALAISAGGVVVSLLEALTPATAYGLLRFYWFRLADVIVPLAVAAADTGRRPPPPIELPGGIWARATQGEVELSRAGHREPGLARRP